MKRPVFDQFQNISNIYEEACEGREGVGVELCVVLFSLLLFFSQFNPGTFEDEIPVLGSEAAVLGPEGAVNHINTNQGQESYKTNLLPLIEREMLVFFMGFRTRNLVSFCAQTQAKSKIH